MTIVVKKLRVQILVLLLTWLAISSVSYADSENSPVDDLRPMAVYKSPTCGCCGVWVDHMKAADFSVRIHHPANLDNIKESLGITRPHHACHTGVKSGYFFEGHIPAEVVKHFLEEMPDDSAGLAVPGMPMGSPGMDVSGPYRPYEVLKIYKDGSSTPYARISIDGVVYLGGTS